MSNPYGITLGREWSEWAAKASVSPTVAAALFLISRSRPLPEIVARLTSGEFEQVVGVIGRWQDCFPPGTLHALNALKSRKRTSSPAPLAVCLSTDQAPSRRHARISAESRDGRTPARRFAHSQSAPMPAMPTYARTFEHPQSAAMSRKIPET
jgi:hypothetical protein